MYLRMNANFHELFGEHCANSYNSRTIFFVVELTLSIIRHWGNGALYVVQVRRVGPGKAYLPVADCSAQATCLGEDLVSTPFLVNVAKV
jgi:hypothetical protein